MDRRQKERERSRKRLRRENISSPPDVCQPECQVTAVNPYRFSEMVGDSCTEITDDVVEIAINLMKAYSDVSNGPYISYYTPAQIHLYTALKSNIGLIPVDRPSINIHPLPGHWVTSFYNTNRNKIYVYDSLMSSSHLKEVRNQLCCLYGNEILKSICYVNVTQQSSEPICGVMAIAFAHTCLTGGDPTTVNFDIKCVRNHLKKCLQEGQLLPFPTLREFDSEINMYSENNNKEPDMFPWIKSYIEDQDAKSKHIYTSTEKGNVQMDRNNNIQCQQRLRKQRSRSNRSRETIKLEKICDKARKKKACLHWSTERVEQQKVKDSVRKKLARSKYSPEALEALKRNDRARKKRMRSPETIEAQKSANVTRKRRARSEYSLETLEALKRTDTARKKRALFELSPETIEAQKSANRARKKKTRSQYSPETLEGLKKMDTARKKWTRCEHSPETLETLKRKDTARKKRAHSQYSPETLEALKRTNTAHKKRRRSEHSLETLETRKRTDTARKKRRRSEYSPETVEAHKSCDRAQKKRARSEHSPETVEAHKSRDQARKKRARSEHSPETVEAHKGRDQARKKRARSEQSPETVEAHKGRDQARKKRARSEQSPETVEAHKGRDQARKKRARSEQSPETVEAHKGRDQARKKRARSEHSPETVEAHKSRDQARKKTARSKQSPETFSKQKDTDKVRKKKARLKQCEKQESTAVAIENFRQAIKQGPSFICCCCWRLLYRRSVVHVNREKYTKFSDKKLNKILTTETSDGFLMICNTCNKKLKNGVMPSQAQANKMSLVDRPHTLLNLCPLETQLVCKIIPFMKIIAMPRGAQHGIRGQVVLVPADLNKVTKNLPRPSSDESQIIALALKRRLTDKSYVQKQYIRPNVVNSALNFLRQNNKCYRDVTIRSDWVEMCESENPDFFKAAVTRENCVLPETGEEENVINDINSEAKNDGPTACISDKDNIRDILDSEDEVELDNPQDFLTDLNNSRQVNSDTCIHPINGIEVHTNEIMNLAPGEGQVPLSVSKEPNWEAMSFPTLFPTAQNTYHVDERREVKLSLKQYFNARLLCKDHRFAESPEYAFAALDISERESVKQNIAITSRKTFHEDINVGQLKNPQKLQKLLTENQLFATFKNIRGTPQYFQQMHLDMLAKLRQFGPYTFFISASAAEFHWPEVIQIVGKQYGQNFTEEQINGMDWQTKRSWLQRNPVTVARHIDYIFEQLWGKVILSGAHPVGQVLNYDLRKEMQGRGTAHFHSAIHVQNAPRLDVDPDDSFASFADRYIKCTLPDDDTELFSLVNTRQRHHHTRTCKKRVCVICRFGFPRPPSDNTVVARVPDNPDDKAAASTILTKVSKAVAALTTDNIPSLQQLLQQANVTPDQYESALKVAHRRTHIVMKRSPADININNYNPVLLKCLRSNMDIQMITSIWACIAYITSYICKPEKTMSELMRKASKEAQDKNITDRLYHISNQLRKGREVSHHESIMRTLSIPLRRSNVAVIFIPTGKQEDRTRILKPKSILDTLEDNDTEIYLPSIHEKYAARPDALNDECLAGFVAKYSTVYPKTSDGSSEEAPECENEIDDNSTKEYIKLKDNMGKIYKRNTPQIIRYHYISKEKDEEQYYHRLLLLYLPWKSEQELKCNDRYREKFEEVKEILIPTIRQYEPYYDEVEHVIDTFDPDEMLPEVWDQISTNIQQDIAHEDNVRYMHTHLDPELVDEQPTDTSKKTSSAKSFTLTPTYQMADQDFHKFVQTLNEKQKYLFDFIFTWATETRLWEDKPPPFYIFLSGSGGVGKSHLVNTIYQGVTRALKTPGQHPDQPTVLLTASTGKAATGINGTTLHSAFALPVKTKASKSSDYKKIGSERLNKMRSAYANLKLIIADEISMFGSHNLQNLHLALQDIFQDYKTPFAGVAILAVGDLLQLNPVGDIPVFKPSSAGYEALAGSLWTRYFQLHELTDIVRQKGDPVFAAILSRVRTGDFTDEDIQSLQELQNTPTESFPRDTVSMFLTNAQAGNYNDQMIEDLPGKVTIHSVDSKRDKHTNTVPVQITTTQIYATGGLPSTLTLAIGATVMITKNIDLPDRLVNGIVGKVEFISIDEQNSLKGTIFIKFSDPNIGRHSKKRSPQHLRNCVPIQAITVSFLLTSECPVPVERTMYPLLLAFGLTAHKSQGSTYTHCIANLELPPNMKSVMQGHAYTMLSRATSRDGLKLVNFSADKIKVNKSALEEMERMREHTSFSWQHPFQNLNPYASVNIGFLNIRSLPAHLSDLVAHKHISRLNALCLTETHTIEESSLEGFCGYFKPTQHGLAMFIQGESTDFENNSALQIMSRIVSDGSTNFVIVVTYRPPQFNKNVFFTLLSTAINAVPKSYNIVLGGDFNLMPNDPVVVQFSRDCGLRQYIEKPTHQLGGTLDLIFVSDKLQCTSEVVPVSYTDHFLTIASVF